MLLQLGEAYFQYLKDREVVIQGLLLHKEHMWQAEALEEHQLLQDLLLACLVPEVQEVLHQVQLDQHILQEILAQMVVIMVVTVQVKQVVQEEVLPIH